MLAAETARFDVRAARAEGGEDEHAAARTQVLQES
jgi:hypothetical protein